MSFTIPIGVLIAKCESKFYEPFVVSRGLARPKGTGVVFVSRFVSGLTPKPADHRTANLAGFKRHFDDVLICVPAGSLFNVAGKSKDIYCRVLLILKS